jgi:hypothetical protein
VPIIICHGGIEGSGYYMEYYEKCLNVAASHENVYLECGQWWAELYEKPLKDPNIGCEKLLWGTDWGASCTAQTWMPGCVPETYVNQDISLGPPAHQIDIWGWSLRELGRLNIPRTTEPDPRGQRRAALQDQDAAYETVQRISEQKAEEMV